MEEISRRLGMSKKTLYKYFNGKLGLLEAIVREGNLEMKELLGNMLTREVTDFHGQLGELIQHVAKYLQNISQAFFNDLKDVAPLLWEEVEAMKREIIYTHFAGFLDVGIANGYLNPKVDKYLLLSLYALALEHLFDPAFLGTLPIPLAETSLGNPATAYEQLHLILFRGIMA